MNAFEKREQFSMIIGFAAMTGVSLDSG